MLPIEVYLTARGHGEGRLPFCGGSLVSAKHVVTAAHCNVTSDLENVVLGAHDVQDEAEGRVVVRISKFIPHPSMQVHNFSTMIFWKN